MRILIAFLLGMREFRCAFTCDFGNTKQNRAYDYGREWAHRLTFRHFED